MDKFLTIERRLPLLPRRPRALIAAIACCLALTLGTAGSIAAKKETSSEKTTKKKADKPDRKKPAKASDKKVAVGKKGKQPASLPSRAMPIAKRTRPPLILSLPPTTELVESPALAEPAAGPGRIDYALLDRRFERLVHERGMTGMAVAIVERGQLNFVKGYGVTGNSDGEPVTVKTAFRWASLSKTVAATLIAKLAEENKLSLGDPIAKFDTSLHLPFDREKIATLTQLLSHQLGLPRNAYDGLLEQGEDPRLIRHALGKITPICAPGACFSYQNVAFDAASEIVARVTGRSYAEAVEENLFAPLGMRNASIGRAKLVGAASWARPTVGGRPVQVDEAYFGIPAAGGVSASILDLGIWMRAQMGEAPTIVSQRVLDVIHAPLVSTIGSARLTEFDREMRGTTYGLGWRNAIYNGHRLIGHRGAVRGYRALILFDPQAKTGVAVLWNSESVRPVGIPLELFDMLYGRPPRDWLKLDGKLPPAADLPTDARND